MYANLFTSLSEEARLWVYPVDKRLTSSETASIMASLDNFINNWQSHGRKVTAEATILLDRFIVLGAEIPEAEISGCGIDASVHAIDSIGKQSGFSLLTGLTVFYRGDEDAILHASRSEFRSKVRSGEINGETLVFDPSITEISQLHTGLFERPAKDSWHATVFRIPSETT